MFDHTDNTVGNPESLSFSGGGSMVNVLGEDDDSHNDVAVPTTEM